MSACAGARAQLTASRPAHTAALGLVPCSNAATAGPNAWHIPGQARAQAGAMLPSAHVAALPLQASTASLWPCARAAASAMRPASVAALALRSVFADAFASRLVFTPAGALAVELAATTAVTGSGASPRARGCPRPVCSSCTRIASVARSSAASMEASPQPPSPARHSPSRASSAALAASSAADRARRKARDILESTRKNACCRGGGVCYLQPI
mmetsp:Transcript_71239/g.201912  ORF Transcript_71239/g.201912 Transcript_71239/m.201912 type:complete len:214 (+) Transcript_71239:764-1405(+)